MLSPFMIPIMLGLKLTGEGYIFYEQERVGYKNRLFHIYKFATMLKDSQNMPGGMITLKKDPRLTPMGGFLRASKINELPQVLNILLGNMSMVGPRPVIPKSFAAYPEEIKKVLYNVKPGLTGIGSIIFRDEESLITEVKKLGYEPMHYYAKYIYPYKGALEMWYQENISFSTDLKILVLTFWQIMVSKSELTFRVLQGLPKRPAELTVAGLQTATPEQLGLERVVQAV